MSSISVVLIGDGMRHNRLGWFDFDAMRKFEPHGIITVIQSNANGEEENKKKNDE